MGRVYEVIDGTLQRWIEAQPVFFVATAPLQADGHVRENGRIVLMFCAFDGPPRILRIHGTGNVHVRGSAGFDALAPRFPAASTTPGVRSIIEVDATLISTSCGYGVPLMPFASHRDELVDWAARKEEVGALDEYHAKKNASSLDGLAGLG